MSHLFLCRGGTHFKFSHGFGNLLTSQLKATCEGEDVDHRICINKYKGNTIVWPDLSADDYINYPITTSIEHLCSYVFTMLYKKIFNSLKQVEYIENSTSTCIDGNDNNERGSDNGGAIHHYKNLVDCFCDSLPGYNGSHLAELKMFIIPNVYLASFVSERFRLLSSSLPEEATDAREDYTEMAFLMFYFFCKLDNLYQDGSYCKLFKTKWDEFLVNESTIFLKRGFNILQKKPAIQWLSDKFA